MKTGCSKLLEVQNPSIIPASVDLQGQVASTVWSLAPDSNPARQVQQVQAGLSRCCSSGMQAPVVIKVKAIRQALYHAITCTVHQLCRQKCRARASAVLNETSSEVPKYSDVLKYSPLPESGSVSVRHLQHPLSQHIDQLLSCKTGVNH